MLKVQNQPQISLSPSFKSDNEVNSYSSPVRDYDYDSFDKENIEIERNKARRQFDEDRAGWDNFADELESSDNKVSKGMGKGARFVATAIGLAGTFVVAKYSSKLTIETFKSLAKSKTVQSAIDRLSGLKKPIDRIKEVTSGAVKNITERPAVKTKLNAIKNSSAVKSARDFIRNEKVQAVLEPVKNTLSSVKNIKINGKKIQSGIENTMAATVVGSDIVDTLAGRNDNKSAVELAAGSSGEV